MPALACGCWSGIWNGVTPPARCAVHTTAPIVVVIDPTVDPADIDGVVRRVREALVQHPVDAGATHHTMDRGTAAAISRMLIDDSPAPAWVWDCPGGSDGCANRICRLAHLIKQAKAAKAAPEPAPTLPVSRLERHICNADDCCTAEARDRAFDARRCNCGCGLVDHGGAHP